MYKKISHGNDFDIPLGAFLRVSSRHFHSFNGLNPSPNTS